MNRPPSTLGLRHVALYVRDLDACLHFYVDLMGMEVEWHPDADNIYLSTAGQDNLALHHEAGRGEGETRLDHIGFILSRAEDVDAWHAFLVDNGVAIKAEPRTHRDGARSLYCSDPEGNTVQVIYHPPIAANVT